MEGSVIAHYLTFLSLSTRKFWIFQMVPPPGFEPGKTWLLRPVAVPVCMSYRGLIFGASFWRVVQDSNLRAHFRGRRISNPLHYHSVNHPTQLNLSQLVPTERGCPDQKLIWVRGVRSNHRPVEYEFTALPLSYLAQLQMLNVKY